MMRSKRKRLRQKPLKTLAELVEFARNNPPTPEEAEAHRRSFAYGNLAFSNPSVTREMVDRVADEMARRAEEPIDFKGLSPEAQKSIEDGLASAKRGEVSPWDRDFTRETDAIEDDSFDIEDVCSPSEARRRCDDARDKLAEMMRPKAPKPR